MNICYNDSTNNLAMHFVCSLIAKCNPPPKIQTVRR